MLDRPTSLLLWSGRLVFDSGISLRVSVTALGEFTPRHDQDELIFQKIPFRVVIKNLR